MNQNQQVMNEDEIEISLSELFFVLWHRLGVIIMTGLVTGIIAAFISSYLLTPTYTSTSQLYILNKSSTSGFSLSLSDLQMGTQLTKDYMVLVKSRPVTEAVIKNLGLDMEHEDLVDIITITNPSDTRILKISVEYKDAYIAKEIVDEIAEVSANQISAIMDIDKPNVVESGVVATNKTSPRTLFNVVIAVILGSVAMAGIIIVRYLMDDTIKSEGDIEKYLGLNTIGLIPFEQNEEEIKRERRHRHKTSAKKSGGE